VVQELLDKEILALLVILMTGTKVAVVAAQGHLEIMVQPLELLVEVAQHGLTV
jgi:hypothetical protein